MSRETRRGREREAVAEKLPKNSGMHEPVVQGGGRSITAFREEGPQLSKDRSAVRFVRG